MLKLELAAIDAEIEVKQTLAEAQSKLESDDGATDVAVDAPSARRRPARRAAEGRGRLSSLPPDPTTGLPAPGPSFLREQELRVQDRRLRAGMSRPSTPTEDWWTAILWIADEADKLVSFVDLAPTAGPPPEPPLARLGPALAGGLSGLILEDAGRLQIRLGFGRATRSRRTGRGALPRSFGRHSGGSRRAPPRCGRTTSRPKC